MARTRAGTGDTPAKRLMRRTVWGAIVLGALAFAIEGGEYGTSDIYTQQGRRARLRAEVDSLRTVVDSLQGELESMNTDDARLERIARERYGMVKGGKEVLYRVTRSSDASAGPVTDARDSAAVRDTV